MRGIALYSTNYGFYNYLLIWLRRAFWLVILVVALSKFSENPNGLTILSILVLVILFRIQSQQLLIYDKSIEVKRRFFLDLMPISTHIEKDDIQNIDIDGNRSLSNDIIQQLIPIGIRYRNRVVVELKDGSSKALNTSIFKEELEMFKRKFEENL